MKCSLKKGVRTVNQMFFRLSSARKQSIPHRIKTPAPAGRGSHTTGCISRQEGQVTPNVPSFSPSLQLIRHVPVTPQPCCSPVRTRDIPWCRDRPSHIWTLPTSAALSHSSLWPSIHSDLFLLLLAAQALAHHEAFAQAVSCSSLIS